MWCVVWYVRQDQDSMAVCFLKLDCFETFLLPFSSSQVLLSHTASDWERPCGILSDNSTKMTMRIVVHRKKNNTGDVKMCG